MVIIVINWSNNKSKIGGRNCALWGHFFCYWLDYFFFFFSGSARILFFFYFFIFFLFNNLFICFLWFFFFFMNFWDRFEWCLAPHLIHVPPYCMEESNYDIISNNNMYKLHCIYMYMSTHTWRIRVHQWNQSVSTQDTHQQTINNPKS